ncbi:transcriptional regulation of mitochondrial recombination-domain-containing protein [Durotheca rogersii]|uniref:transcriptional regulation of mitochondrial recombination-domain-containing protein n=1 Tax=Durotheca rogersii TaxID=419775 RepID=UPI00221FC748|nr:transcriptional regulation of mitochondrial recombination-domain-containing protein [Durotheca rogersii]KAI5868060.1 transcriptional regulation of mitochondrial recombination-domain-containing protein [Durotheca rogersii]
MALTANSIAAQLGKLSLVGIPRAPVRFKHISAKVRKRLEAGKKKVRKPHPLPQLPPHHGEKIWVFHHFFDGITVYSHSPVPKASKMLRQIPFNGKKLRPSSIRKDLWRPLAMIQFPEGSGEVGRSVYQRLRECQSLHALCWPDSLLADPKDGHVLTKHDRGRRLNDQKANAIADIAAVLAGLGKGNKMWVAAPDPADDAAAAADPESSTRPPDAATPPRALLKAEIWWMNGQDRGYAKKWPSNVTHHLFAEAVLQPLDAETPDGAAPPTEGGGKEGDKPRTAPAELVAAEQLQKGGDQRPSA